MAKLASTQHKYTVAQEQVQRLQQKVEETRHKWAQALGNEQAALAACEELRETFRLRWNELIQALSSNENGDDVEGSPSELLQRVVDQAKDVAALKHQLSQALENVRQAESARENLRDANDLNDVLQAKIDALEAAPAAASTTEESAEAAAAAQLGESDKTDNKLDKVERLKHEYRKLKKELAAVHASKDAAKAKLERLEKERDRLLTSNSRLLKQATENDEINAKSLSTILHLKSQTEQLATEKSVLDQSVKSSSQTALSARLAANAKERLSEELVTSNKSLESKVTELEHANDRLQNELNQVRTEYSDASGKIQALQSELELAGKRFEELGEESRSKDSEILSLRTSLKASLDESTSLKQEIAKSNGASGSSATPFTAEQLATQVQVLKSRLECPVCHFREKSVVITRCRHLHCKECVEEQILNRSRKCPTCNQKFTEKEVGDVWL